MNADRRVLLVEDNASTIEVVEMELKWLGYQVTVARDGLEAVESANKEPPDVILMDIHLPKLSGFDAVRRIRATAAGQQIAILAATAKALAGDREKCLEAGCDGYIAKPFTHRELDAAIHSVLKLRS